MEENSENASPYSSSSNGSSGGSPAASTSPSASPTASSGDSTTATTTTTMSAANAASPAAASASNSTSTSMTPTSNTSNGTVNGNYVAASSPAAATANPSPLRSNGTNGTLPPGNAAAAAAASSGAGVPGGGQPQLQQQQQAINGPTGGFASMPNKIANSTKPRSRLVGVPPPPVYSPLGASSPSLLSNSTSFAGGGSGANSNVSSAASTPSATPQTSNAQLPGISNSGGPPSFASNPQQQQQQQQVSQSTYGSGNGAGHAINNNNNNNGSSSAHMYPALHLHPLNDTFIPKQISLYPPAANNRIKIGRQTNAKTVPAPNNGYFDSKVLSRMHAEVWAEGNKVFIKDVKSSNGTFINGERLSAEGVESDVFELHNNDMVEFGIDITSEDSKTIVHHKVAARCFLVMNADDAVAASRNFANYYRDLGDSPMHPRRAGMGPGKGGMAGSGMNIDQVLTRLQSELQKSRETGADLGSLTSTIGEIHETLGGNLPGPPVPAFRVPPFVPPNPNAPASQQQQQAAQQSQAHAQTQQVLTSLQVQLQETQSALSGHVERIRNLEGLLEEQERMRSELREVKERMEEARGEWERLREDRERSTIDLSDEDGDPDEKEDLQSEDIDDDDNTRTIRLEENDLNDLVGGKMERSVDAGTKDKADRRTGEDSQEQSASAAFAAAQARLEAENSALAERMEALSHELSAASQLSSNLRTQYIEAAETIRGLEDKVTRLEQALQSERAVPKEADAPPAETKTGSPEEDNSIHREDILREVESRFTDWKKSFEEAVQRERKGWEEEREQLRLTLSEWEKRSESLLHSQANAAAGGSGRRKRRSKASTVGSSSEESSDSQEDSYEEEGFVSPVTEEEAHSPGKGGEDRLSADGMDYPKRPRSRRRRRHPDGHRSHRRSSGLGITGRPSAGDNAARENGGSAIARRRSWIPFGQSVQETKEEIDNLRESITKDPAKKPDHRRHDPSTVLEHPALPIVSAAGIVVIGYLAYSAIMQHQK